jgi:hypothetical protein
MPECVCCKKSLPWTQLEPLDKCLACGGEHAVCALCGLSARKLGLSEVRDRVVWKQCPADGRVGVMLEICYGDQTGS